MAAAPPLGNPRAPPPRPFPLYIVREREGSRTLPLTKPLPLSCTSSFVALGDALPENHELHHHHTVVLSEFSLNVSSTLAGSRRRRRPRVVRVLNAEALFFGA